MNALYSIFAPHVRARRAIDEAHDAAKDGVEVAPEDRAWLEAHLATCEACRDFQTERRALFDLVRGTPELKAPTGFSGRVLLAAKARGKVATTESKPAGLRWAWAGMAVAGLVIAFSVAPLIRNQEVAHRIEVSGVAADLPAPQFQVRAVGVGPAKARASVRGIVEAAGGQVLEDGNRLHARIPRASLVGVLQALAKQGTYKVVQASPGELDPGLQEIGIAFEVE